MAEAGKDLGKHLASPTPPQKKKQCRRLEPVLGRGGKRASKAGTFQAVEGSEGVLSSTEVEKPEVLAKQSSWRW